MSFVTRYLEPALVEQSLERRGIARDCIRVERELVTVRADHIVAQRAAEDIKVVGQLGARAVGGALRPQQRDDLVARDRAPACEAEDSEQRETAALSRTAGDRPAG